MPIVGAQLQWLIQITTLTKGIWQSTCTSVNRNLSSEVQYYHVGLPMSILILAIVLFAHGVQGIW